MNKIITILLFLTLILNADLKADQNRTNAPTIRITGRDSATVTTTKIRLRDIADVSSTNVKDDEIIIALKKIEIDASPNPGEKSTIPAARVLERLRQERVNVNELIYVFPRVITVDRASRALTKAEIDTALNEALAKMGRELTIKSVDLKEQLYVPPSARDLKALPFNTNKPGTMGFNLITSVPGEEDHRFQITAQVDELVEVPIARYSLPKGRRIQTEDLVMARLNVAALPSDTAYKSSDVVGQETNSEIQYGETFRRTRLTTPPVISAGSKVIMIYKSGALEATASGTALDSGILGQDIRVKNESSKKIVTGRVIEGGKVGVNP